MSSILGIFNVLRTLNRRHRVKVARLSRHIVVSGDAICHFLRAVGALNCITRRKRSRGCSLALGLFRLNTHTLRGISLVHDTSVRVHRVSHLAGRAVRLNTLSRSDVICVRGVSSVCGLHVCSQVKHHGPLCDATVNGMLLT